MRWAIPAGRVMGVDIRVHVSFALLLGYVAWVGWQADGWSGGAWSLLFTVLLFACVVAHELAHSVAARRCGVAVRGILLLPIGGVASLASMPRRPVQELFIAAAGPVASVALAFLIGAVAGPWWPPAGGSLIPDSWGALGRNLALTNLVLALFNLVPAFPMDGGRILRSLLAMVIPHGTATAVAVAVGKVLAVGFVALGLTGSPLLVLVGLFVLLGADGESRQERGLRALRGARAADLMATDLALHPDEPVWRCQAIHAASGSPDVVVAESGRLLGLVEGGRWAEALRSGRGEEPVGRLVGAEVRHVRPDEDLADIWNDLMSAPVRSYPVMDGDRLAGVLTAAAVLRYAATRRRADDGGAGGRRGSGGIVVDLG